MDEDCVNLNSRGTTNALNSGPRNYLYKDIAMRIRLSITISSSVLSRYPWNRCGSWTPSQKGIFHSSLSRIRTTKRRFSNPRMPGLTVSHRDDPTMHAAPDSFADPAQSISVVQPRKCTSGEAVRSVSNRRSSTAPFGTVSNPLAFSGRWRVRRVVYIFR